MDDFDEDSGNSEDELDVLLKSIERNKNRKDLSLSEQTSRKAPVFTRPTTPGTQRDSQVPIQSKVIPDLNLASISSARPDTKPHLARRPSASSSQATEDALNHRSNPTIRGRATSSPFTPRKSEMNIKKAEDIGIQCIIATSKSLSIADLDKSLNASLSRQDEEYVQKERESST